MGLNPACDSAGCVTLDKLLLTSECSVELSKIGNLFVSWSLLEVSRNQSIPQNNGFLFVFEAVGLSVTLLSPGSHR